MWEFLKDPAIVGLAIGLVMVTVWWVTQEWPDATRAALRRLTDVARASPLLLVFALTIAVVAAMNPAKAGLALWGVSKIALAGYAGYWVDRMAFRPEDRPHRLIGIAQGTAWKRRALIIAAAVVAGGLIP
jgi:hypothetical protein